MDNTPTPPELPKTTQPGFDTPMGCLGMAAVTIAVGLILGGILIASDASSKAGGMVVTVTGILSVAAFVTFGVLGSVIRKYFRKK